MLILNDPGARCTVHAMASERDYRLTGRSAGGGGGVMWMVPPGGHPAAGDDWLKERLERLAGHGTDATRQRLRPLQIAIGGRGCQMLLTTSSNVIHVTHLNPRSSS